MVEFKDKDVVLVRDADYEAWRVAVFREMSDDMDFPYRVYGDTPKTTRYAQCIHYAGNEDKINTITD